MHLFIYLGNILLTFACIKFCLEDCQSKQGSGLYRIKFFNLSTFKSGNSSLWWEAILRIVKCLAVSLVFTH